MNRSTLISHIGTQHPPGELQKHEREARRLKSETSCDPVARFVIALDLRVRRLAHRIAVLLQASNRTPSSRVR